MTSLQWRTNIRIMNVGHFRTSLCKTILFSSLTKGLTKGLPRLSFSNFKWTIFQGLLSPKSPSFIANSNLPNPRAISRMAWRSAESCLFGWTVFSDVDLSFCSNIQELYYANLHQSSVLWLPPLPLQENHTLQRESWFVAVAMWPRLLLPQPTAEIMAGFESPPSQTSQQQRWVQPATKPIKNMGFYTLRCTCGFPKQT